MAKSSNPGQTATMAILFLFARLNDGQLSQIAVHRSDVLRRRLHFGVRGRHLLGFDRQAERRDQLAHLQAGEHARIVLPRAVKLRVAVTGSKVSPGLFESLELLGKDETLRRLRAAAPGSRGAATARGTAWPRRRRPT